MTDNEKSVRLIRPGDRLTRRQMVAHLNGITIHFKPSEGDFHMKKQIARFILALLTGVLMLQATHAQQANPPTPPQPQFTEDQLEERFNQILAKELDADKVLLSFAATRKLESIVRDAARGIIERSKLDQLPVADKNFKDFAKALIARGTKPFEETRITLATITDVLNGWHNPLMSDPTKMVPGICPLFPICP